MAELRNEIPPVPAIAARQYGVFTTGQAVAEGWTARQVRRRLESRRWHRVVGDGIAASSPPTWTTLQRAAAARLTVADGVVSHLTAARLHGFPVDEPPSVHVITEMRHRQGTGLVPHRVPLPAAGVVTLGGFLPVTDPRRTAVDCLAALPSESALRLWSWLGPRGVLDLTGLQAGIAERAGRPGVHHLRRVLELVRAGASSEAEFRCHRLLQRAGLTGWTANVPVTDFEGLIGVVPVLFGRRRVAIEVGGRIHRSVQAEERERLRRRRLVAAGYVVLRFTWTDLQQQPGEVLRQIREALR